MHQWKIEERLLGEWPFLVEGLGNSAGRDGAGFVIGSKGFACAAEDVAGELIEEEDEGEGAGGSGLPGVKVVGAGLGD